MNKAVALGLSAVLVCSLAACGTGTGSAPTTSEVPTTAETSSQTETVMDTTIREILPEANVMEGFAAGDSGVANAQDAVAKRVEGLGITP